MPGFHTKKQQRQAKHIIAGYEKRGTSSDVAKHIAWATVNKEKNAKNESWMFNGAGQPVFMGKENASQFDPSGTTSPGASYLPDEVAKMLVKESGLRKSDTIPKRVIIGYLESMGLSAGLAVDVAKVLRDVYGITPTFDESTLYARSGALIEELTLASESFPMPFAVDDEPKVLNEVELIGSFIQSELMASEDEDYDLALAHLALLSPREFCDVVDFHEWVGTDVFNYIESIAQDGPDGAAESVVEGLCWPHRIQFMPESVQELFSEDAVDDVLKKGTARSRSKLPVTAKVKVPSKIMPRKGEKFSKKGSGSVPSFRKQMAKHGQDLPSDPLAAKKPGAALAAHQKRKLDKALKSHDPFKPHEGPSAMKRAGGTAVGLMKKVGAAAKAIHTPSKHNPDVGPALKKAGSVAAKVGGHIAKGAAKAGVHAAAGLAGAAGHVGGAALRGLGRGLFGAKKKEAEHGGHDSGETVVAKREKQPEKKPGLLRRAVGGIAKAVGGFAKHVAHHAKEGFKNATPGIQHVAGGHDSEEAKPKKERVAKSAVPNEAVLRSGPLLSEMAHALNGTLPPDEDPAEEMVRSPAEVIEGFDADTVVDMAALEAISEMDWNSIAGVAGFVMLEADKFLSLIQSYKESRSAFRTEWFRLEENGDKPNWMTIGSFMTLSKLSLDEAVVPRLVYWAARALQAADEGVASYVAEEYPELGKTVYGPAGNPKEGPQIAKSFMTPQPAGTMTPTDSDACTTRMFSDPAERDKLRKEKLADVMDAINSMRQQAAAAGVPPEGMFLNIYRDMHREKVRYS